MGKSIVKVWGDFMVLSCMDDAILDCQVSVLLQSNSSTTSSTFAATLYDKTIKHASKWFILTKIMQNLEFIKLKYVTYTQPLSVFF